MLRAIAATLLLVAMGGPVQGRPPGAQPPQGPRNVALGHLVYARPHSFWAPGAFDAQAGLQRLTDGVFAGQASVTSRQAIVLAPYTADLPELPLASLPEAERIAMPRAQAHLEVDLGGVYAVWGLVLEADASGDYLVEGSTNGRFWRTLWTAGAAFGSHGFVARASGPLRRQADVRYVRVSGEASYGLMQRPETFPGESRRVLYAVGELQVLSEQRLPRRDTILPGMDRE